MHVVCTRYAQVSKPPEECVAASLHQLTDSPSPWYTHHTHNTQAEKEWKERSLKTLPFRHNFSVGLQEPHQHRVVGTTGWTAPNDWVQWMFSNECYSFHEICSHETESFFLLPFFFLLFFFALLFLFFVAWKIVISWSALFRQWVSPPDFKGGEEKNTISRLKDERRSTHRTKREK